MLRKFRFGQKPTYVKFAEDIDLFGLFERINAVSDTCFILESLGAESRLSRYSLIGFDPQHNIVGEPSALFLDGTRFAVPNPYYALRELVPTDILARNYAGGLIGYLGYDAMNFMEPALQVRRYPGFPPFRFGVYTDGLVLDKMTGELFYFHYGTNRQAKLESVLAAPAPKYNLTITLGSDSLTREQYARTVEQTKEEIRAGNTFQCQVGFRKEFTRSGNPLPLYRRLREVNPSPFMYFVRFGEQYIIGASPELLFKLSDGVMETYPLAGTVRRGATEEEDTKLARQLLNDPKEIAEHNMLVDLHRNDIGRVAEFGSVKVKSLMDIRKFSHVQHISSEISGHIRAGEDMFSALAANFPAGTLTGAPKIESMKIIDRMEPTPRGPYGGALGHFGFNGNCTFAIPIRTLFIDGEQGYTQASGGVVYDSTAEGEYDEVQRKMRAIVEVLSSFTAKP
ncbi:MAG: anthranilate synthase component I family protein [Patescibacteria group bacterium]|nr:anthranilate synthase component I family protein [Patescibacteria group bacterium]